MHTINIIDQCQIDDVLYTISLRDDDGTVGKIQMTINRRKRLPRVQKRDFHADHGDTSALEQQALWGLYNRQWQFPKLGNYIKKNKETKKRICDQRENTALRFTIFLYLEFPYFVPVSINKSLFRFLLVQFPLRLLSLSL